MKPLSTILVALFLACIAAHGQTLVNRGATIHVREGAVMQVNGDTENREGEIRLYDSSRVTFNGKVRLVLGGLYMLRNSLATIERDLTIDLTAVCWRYDPGVMNVHGTIYNDGELTNDGEINIGRP